MLNFFNTFDHRFELRIFLKKIKGILNFIFHSIINRHLMSNSSFILIQTFKIRIINTCFEVVMISLYLVLILAVMIILEILDTWEIMLSLSLFELPAVPTILEILDTWEIIKVLQAKKHLRPIQWKLKL